MQIVSDRSGKNPVHFGTRNCSIQSTGLQKRIEVAPGFDSSSIEYDFDADKLLEDITRHSLALARKVGYDNVGTWEWIVTKDGSPFLMEVNTRIQVENGVSARISKVKGQGDVDIIAEQIRIASANPSAIRRKTSPLKAWASNTASSPKIPTTASRRGSAVSTPSGWPSHPWLKMHTHVPTDESYEIPTEFDPNLALAIIWGENLEQAKERGMQFLDELTLQGENQSGELKSNVNFLRANTGRILRF